MNNENKRKKVFWKNIIYKLLYVLIIGFLFSVGLSIYNNSPRLKYEYIEEKDAYKIVGYYGQFKNLEIHDKYKGKPVINIGFAAFKDCEFQNVVIPGSITLIEPYAFYNCKNLKKVEFEFDSIHTINPYTFAYCSSLEVIDIPTSVNEIQNNAFYKCSSLKLVYLPNSSYLLEKIGINAFGGCVSLLSISIPSTVEVLSGFNDCINLTTVTIGDRDFSRLETIDDFAFNNCVKLSSINIPDSVRRIGKNAFSNTSIQNITFGDESNLIFIDNDVFSLSKIKTLTLPKSLAYIAPNTLTALVSELESIYFRGTEADWNKLGVDTNASVIYDYHD